MVGIDASLEQIKGAPQLPNVSYVAGDAHKLPIEPGTADLILVGQVRRPLGGEGATHSWRRSGLPWPEPKGGGPGAVGLALIVLPGPGEAAFLLASTAHAAQAATTLTPLSVAVRPSLLRCPAARALPRPSFHTRGAWLRRFPAGAALVRPASLLPVGGASPKAGHGCAGRPHVRRRARAASGRARGHVSHRPRIAPSPRSVRSDWMKQQRTVPALRVHLSPARALCACVPAARTSTFSTRSWAPTGRGPASWWTTATPVSGRCTPPALRNAPASLS